jgi:hypothetical protein
MIPLEIFLFVLGVIVGYTICYLVSQKKQGYEFEPEKQIQKPGKDTIPANAGKNFTPIALVQKRYHDYTLRQREQPVKESV